jgi:anti-sigma factor RsiW
MSTLSHAELAELLGAFALDAVDADEATLIEAHLVDCPRCRDEVARHREVAAALAFVGADAPEGLWARIADNLDTGPSEPELARLYPLRSRKGGVARWAAAALAAAAAVVIVGLGVEVNHQRTQLGQIQSALPRVSLDRAVQAALVDPATAKIRLQSDDQRTFMTAVLSRDGTGYLVTNNLPALTPDKTYQLWGVIGGSKISLGVLGTHPELIAFHASAPFQALAVTAEQSGGVIASQQKAVVLGSVDPAQSPTSA